MKNTKVRLSLIDKNYKAIIMLLVGALLISNLGTFLITRRSEEDVINNFQNPYPLIDISRNFVDKNNFIVNIQPLREFMREFVIQNEPNLVSIYFEVLNTGANVSINTDERFWPASLSKVPTAMVVLKKVELGEWKLSNELVLFEEDKDSRFGDLYKKPIGTRFSVEELIKEMISKSDNTALKMFIRNLDSTEFDKIIDNLGLEELYDDDYNISAKEYSRIFRSLYNSNFLEPYYSQLLLRWLSESSFNEYLGSAVQGKAIFAHKIGEQIEQQTFLDSGIVYIPDRAYLITVLIKINDEEDKILAKEKAENIMEEISKEAYEYIQNF